MPRCWTVGASPDHEAATRLRHQIRNELVRCGVHRVDDAELLTWELIINAVRHTRTGCVVRIECRPRRAHVEVRDRARCSVEPRSFDPDREGGHGLELVSGLSADWGVDPTEDGKAVWFDMVRAS